MDSRREGMRMESIGFHSRSLSPVLQPADLWQCIDRQHQAARGGEAFEDPEGPDDTDFTPAGQLEMMVQRTHLEDTLARCFERNDLNDDR